MLSAIGHKVASLTLIFIFIYSTQGMSQTAAIPTENFYKGKIINVYSGQDAGGTYTAYAHLLERSMGKYIPGNPKLIVKLMTGASGLTLANWLYNVAPQDGLSFGIFQGRIGLEPIIDSNGPKFDGRKFTWIGSMSTQTYSCFTWFQSGLKTLDDLKSKESIFAAGATDGAGSVIPRMMNAMLGTKIKVVLGYAGETPMLAMQRGEADGRCYGWDGMKALKPDWIADRKIYTPIQTGLSRHPDLPDVPFMMDLVNNPEDHKVLELVFAPDEMGRPFASTPNVAPDRTTALRTAFMNSLSDPELINAAKQERLELDGPIPGEKIQSLIDELYNTSPAIAEKARSFRKSESNEPFVGSK
jgi:hypothetical protein